VSEHGTSLAVSEKSIYKCERNLVSLSNGGQDTVLTMVYNTQNYWVFGLFPSSGILENIKHDVSEIESVSILR
jgi:hypothetical protein